jgi:hypothetical protein
MKGRSVKESEPRGTVSIPLIAAVLILASLVFLLCPKPFIYRYDPVLASNSGPLSFNGFADFFEEISEKLYVATVTGSGLTSDARSAHRKLADDDDDGVTGPYEVPCGLLLYEL